MTTTCVQCVELGFDVQSVLTALRRNENVVEKAVEDLIKYNGALPYSSDESSSTSPSTSSSSSAESGFVLNALKLFNCVAVVR